MFSFRRRGDGHMRIRGPVVWLVTGILISWLSTLSPASAQQSQPERPALYAQQTESNSSLQNGKTSDAREDMSKSDKRAKRRSSFSDSEKSTEEYPEPFSSSMGAELVKMLVSLLLIIALILLAMWALKKYFPRAFSLTDAGKEGSEKGRIEIVDHRPIGNKRNLLLVRVGRREILVASTEDSVEMLDSWPRGREDRSFRDDMHYGSPREETGDE
ncbi:hypothetical protein GF324_02440 [bacterium]|nr:hypothetical protein [bacterium]